MAVPGPAWTGSAGGRTDHRLLGLATNLDAAGVGLDPLPGPLYDAPIFGRNGALFSFPDLLDPVGGVVGDYDGAVHLAAAAARDMARGSGSATTVL